MFSAVTMVLDLPLCKTNNRLKMFGALSRLKKKRAKLAKNKLTDGGLFDQFVSEEFVFSPPEENSRSVFLYYSIAFIVFKI